MKKTKVFSTLLNRKWFGVIYEIKPDGTKTLLFITYDTLPIDIAELYGSHDPNHIELYEHILNAMNNNAQSIEVEEPQILN